MVGASELIMDGEKANPKCRSKKGEKGCGGSGFVTIYNPNEYTYTCHCITSKRSNKDWQRARDKARDINIRLRASM